MEDLHSINGRDRAEKLYILILNRLQSQAALVVPFLRRIQRFMALPYLYFFWTNWSECSKGKLSVAYDFLYIFFVLKSFPDNYSPCRLWSIPRQEWHFYYGSNYNPLQRKKLRKSIQKKKYEIVYEDKRLCEDICKAYKLPIPKSFGVLETGIDIVEFLKCRHQESRSITRFIVKPLNGKGGHSILIFEVNEHRVFLYNSGCFEPCERLVSTQSYIVQEFIPQHENLLKVSKSTNTVRVVTALTKSDEVLIIGAYMRFGNGSTLIDNLSAGGLAVPILLDRGILGHEGIDRHGKKFSAHPTSGYPFEGMEIPMWSEVCTLAENVQKSLSYHKLLGMDIAIGQTNPIIIEINSIYDNIDLEQVCGPILKTPKVYQFYKDNDLLINRRQKKSTPFSPAKSFAS